MTINHIHFNRTNQYGSKLASSLSQMENGDDSQADVRDMILQMIALSGGSPDPSNIANFDEVVKRFEIADYVPNNAVTDAQRTEAQKLWLEIDSAFSKTSGNGSVSNVRAARDQLFSKLRG